MKRGVSRGRGDVDENPLGIFIALAGLDKGRCGLPFPSFSRGKKKRGSLGLLFGSGGREVRMCAGLCATLKCPCNKRKGRD